MYQTVCFILEHKMLDLNIIRRCTNFISKLQLLLFKITFSSKPFI